MIFRISQFFLLLAAAVSSWLAWSSLHGGVAGCGAEPSGCDPVLGSAWARIGAMPVSVLGAACYLLTLAAGYCRWPRLMRLGAATILFAAIWFMALQIFYLKHLCAWCSACHAIAGIAALGILGNPSKWKKEAVAAMFLVGTLSAVQVYAFDLGGGTALSTDGGTPRRPAAENLISIQSSDQIRLCDGAIMISAHQVPELGSALWIPPAILVQQPELALKVTQPVLVLGDWSCIHCRRLYERLSSAVTQGDKLLEHISLMFIPVSLTTEARELHRLMLTAWFADRAAYGQIADRITRGELTATPAVITTALHAHFTQSRWAEIAPVYATAVENLLKLGDDVYSAAVKRAPIASLPMLISPYEIMVGDVSNEELQGLLQRAQSVQDSEIQAIREERRLGKGRIEFDSTRVAAPPVAAGEPARVTWHFRNTGTEPLSLLGVQTGCGCAVAEDWQKTVPPGASDSFTVIYDAKGRQVGPNHYTVLLITNASNARPQDQGIELQATVTALPPR